MKFRRAAALALVGWYLVTAPISRKPGTTDKWVIDKTAPLSSWMKYTNWFDCLSDCERFRDYYHSLAMKYSNPIDETKGYNAIAGMSTATCIAMDDPRLKPK